MNALFTEARVALFAKAIAVAKKRALPQATYALMYAYPPVFQMVLKRLAGLPYVRAYVVWAALLFALHVVVWRIAVGDSPAFWAVWRRCESRTGASGQARWT